MDKISLEHIFYFYFIYFLKLGPTLVCSREMIFDLSAHGKHYINYFKYILITTQSR